MYMLVLKCFNKTKPIFKIYICWGFVFKLFFLKDPFCGSISYLTIIQVVSALLNTAGLCREGAAAKQWVPISQNHLSLLPNWLLKGQAHTDTHTQLPCRAEPLSPPSLPKASMCDLCSTPCVCGSGRGTWVLRQPGRALELLSLLPGWAAGEQGSQILLLPRCFLTEIRSPPYLCPWQKRLKHLPCACRIQRIFAWTKF